MKMTIPDNPGEAAAYANGFAAGVGAFAALLKSARHDIGYPADAHVFILHDLMLANIISKRLLKDN